MGISEANKAEAEATVKLVNAVAGELTAVYVKHFPAFHQATSSPSRAFDAQMLALGSVAWWLMEAAQGEAKSTDDLLAYVLATTENAIRFAHHCAVRDATQGKVQ